MWHSLISFYLSVEDGAGNVERGHAIGKKILSNHAGPLEETGATYSDLLMLKLDGPASPSEIAQQSAESVLHLTDLSREFLVEWRGRHGARFRCYTKRLGPEKPKCLLRQQSRDDSCKR